MRRGVPTAAAGRRGSSASRPSARAPAACAAARSRASPAGSAGAARAIVVVEHGQPSARNARSSANTSWSCRAGSGPAAVDPGQDVVVALVEQRLESAQLVLVQVGDGRPRTGRKGDRSPSRRGSGYDAAAACGGSPRLAQGTAPSGCHAPCRLARPAIYRKAAMPAKPREPDGRCGRPAARPAVRAGCLVCPASGPAVAAAAGPPAPPAGAAVPRPLGHLPLRRRSTRAPDLARRRCGEMVTLLARDRVRTAHRPRAAGRPTGSRRRPPAQPVDLVFFRAFGDEMRRAFPIGGERARPRPARPLPRPLADRPIPDAARPERTATARCPLYRSDRGPDARAACAGDHGAALDRLPALPEWLPSALLASARPGPPGPRRCARAPARDAGRAGAGRAGAPAAGLRRAAGQPAGARPDRASAGRRRRPRAQRRRPAA